MGDLLHLLTEIERNDGETPAQHRAISELHQRLTVTPAGRAGALWQEPL
ncbi:hypothetical protein [Saccharomonospora xinjiangensis]|nr:hypothetical protein [Saccharomonospora xinjiangensis]